MNLIFIIMTFVISVWIGLNLWWDNVRDKNKK